MNLGLVVIHHSTYNLKGIQKIAHIQKIRNSATALNDLEVTLTDPSPLLQTAGDGPVVTIPITDNNKNHDCSIITSRRALSYTN
ncbi:hypothetical protein J6590_010962 [Homalodisca vitripennis]|nr:hypothetical protein J6590_010962 [Homalodisca vitripennis]